MTDIKYESIIKVLENDSRLEEIGIKTIKCETDFPIYDYKSDILWTIEHERIEKKIIIEIKDNVKREIIRDDIKHLEFLVRNLESNFKTGILLFDSNATKDALQYCTEKNLYIFKIEEYTEEDWKDKVKEIKVDLKALSPYCKNIKFNFDKEQTTNILKEKGLKFYNLNISAGPESKILKRGNDDYLSVNDIIEPYYKKIEEKDYDKEIHFTHEFKEPVFVKSEIGYFKISSIEFDEIISVINHPIVIDGGKDVGFAIGFSIVKNLLKNPRIANFNQL